MGGRKDAIKEEFSVKLGWLTKSEAYLELCEEVYGYRAYLFNMMDKAQLDHLLNGIPITPEDTVLEGNAELCAQKLRETEMGLELYERGLASRYLYAVGEK